MILDMAEKPKKPKPPKATPASGPWTPEAIKALRDRLKLTQEAFAERLGVGQAVVAGWERRHRKPSRQSLMLLDLLAAKKL